MTWAAPTTDGGDDSLTYDVYYKKNASGCPSSSTIGGWEQSSTGTANLTDSVSGLDDDSSYRVCVRTINDINGSRKELYSGWVGITRTTPSSS